MVYKLHFLVNFILVTFYWFYCKWNCFSSLLFSFFDCSLLLYRNTVDFCILMLLYPATLLKSFISCDRFFWVDSFGFFIYKTMSSANRDNFTSFPVWLDAFYFIFLLTDLAKTSSVMLGTMDESGHLSIWFLLLLFSIIANNYLLH